jgi:hypothetical protein
MPSFAEQLSADDVKAIYAYLVQKAVEEGKPK